MSTPTNTIDITDLVEKTRQTFVSWAVLYLFGLEGAIPGMEWINLPVLRDIDQEILKVALDALSRSFIMLAFFENTAIRKAAQAKNFAAAVEEKDSLPPTATQAEVKAKEAAQMLAFKNFVMVTN